MFTDRPELAATHTHVILECATERQRRAVCVTPRYDNSVSIMPTLRSIVRSFLARFFNFMGLNLECTMYGP